MAELSKFCKHRVRYNFITEKLMKKQIIINKCVGEYRIHVYKIYKEERTMKRMFL